MANIPFFSVITLTFNSSRTISRTIQSLKNQTFKNFEVIFQDGGSNDDTISLINSKINSFREATLVSEKDGGIYDGLNKALKKTRGKFVCVLHADDVFFSDHTLEIVASKLNQGNVDLAYGDVLFSSKSSNGKIVREWIAGSFRKIKLFFGWMPPHTSLFIKNKVISSNNTYRTDLKVSSDYDFILRIFKSNNIRVLYLKMPIVKMEIGGLSTSGINSLILNFKEDFLVLYDHFGIFSVFPLIFKRITKINQYLFFTKIKLKN